MPLSDDQAENAVSFLTATAHPTPTQRFEKKEYDVTNKCEALMCCVLSLGSAGCTKVTLVLEEEEAFLTKKNNCQNEVQRRPYAQLGAVDKSNNCVCCWAVKSDLTSKDSPGLCPGWGCQQDLVEELVHELKERMVKRGNIGQIKHQENMGLKLEEMAVKVDLLMDHYGIQFPPTPETMARLYPNGAPTLPAAPAQNSMGP